MDIRTLQYYSLNSGKASAIYNSALYDGVSHYFPAFAAGSSVLDIGCGSGRDMSILMSLGYDVYGVDASPEMLFIAKENFPDLDGRFREGVLPSDGLFFDRRFENILCSAVLMHIPDNEITDSAYTIRRNMNEKGRLLLSVPSKRGDLDSGNRTSDGRLHIIRSAEFYMKLFESVGLKTAEYYLSRDSIGREDVKWEVMLFQQ